MTVNAATISRLLKKAGHPRSDDIASGRVRGWGNTTEGFRARKDDDQVHVDYTSGSWATHLTPGQRSAAAAEFFAAATKELTEAGYTVTQQQYGYQNASTRLVVTR